jgi:hypothetical protein
MTLEIGASDVQYRTDFFLSVGGSLILVHAGRCAMGSERAGVKCGLTWGPGDGLGAAHRRRKGGSGRPRVGAEVLPGRVEDTGTPGGTESVAQSQQPWEDRTRQDGAAGDRAVPSPSWHSV